MNENEDGSWDAPIFASGPGCPSRAKTPDDTNIYVAIIIAL